jgi:HEPN domain-containing protein
MKLLGVCDAADAADFLYTINFIKQKRNDDPLDPAEIVASRISLAGLLQDDSWPTDEPIYFLDKKFRLRPVHEVCMDDALRWASRVAGTLHFIDSDVVQSICFSQRSFQKARDLGLQFLSDLVAERLVRPAPEHYLQRNDLTELEEVLGSEAFKRALLRICAAEDPSRLGRSPGETTLQRIKSVRNCALIPVATIETQMVDTRTGEALQQGHSDGDAVDRTQRACFGDLDNDRILAVPSTENLTRALAREINKLLDNLVRNELLLEVALGTYPPEQITTALDAEDVPSSATDSYGTFGLGLPLLDQHHACLSQDIGERFAAGEMVAYLVREDPDEFIYARVVTSIRTGRLDGVLQIVTDKSGRTEEVSSLFVYKFNGDATQSISEMALVAIGEVRDGAPPGTVPDQVRNDGDDGDEPDARNRTLREKLLEVEIDLRDALGLPEREKKQVVRRLYLRWHPDKNPDDSEHCTEVFKYLQACIDADHVLPLPAEAQPDICAICQSDFDRAGGPPLTKLQCGHEFHTACITQAFQRNRRCPLCRADYRNTDSGGNAGAAFGGFGGFGGAGFGGSGQRWESYARRSGQAHGRYERRAQPDAATSRRWSVQASSDLAAARALWLAECWSQACFYSHQAVEVAVKAALYRTVAHTDQMLTHHRLPEFAQLLCSQPGGPDVQNEVAELRDYYISSRYPNARSNHGTTPSQRLGAGEAAGAVGAAERAVARLQSFCDGA